MPDTLTPQELAAIRERDAELRSLPDAGFFTEEETDRRALLAHIDTLAGAARAVLAAFGSEAQTEPGPSRARQRADALDGLRAILNGEPHDA